MNACCISIKFRQKYYCQGRVSVIRKKLKAQNTCNYTHVTCFICMHAKQCAQFITDCVSTASGKTQCDLQLTVFSAIYTTDDAAPSRLKLPLHHCIMAYNWVTTISARRCIKTWTSRQLATSSAIRLQQNVRVAVSEDKRKLAIKCEGEQERRFHGVWLRHNCRCPICTSASTGQTIVDPRLLTKDLKLERVDIKGACMLLIVLWST